MMAKVLVVDDSPTDVYQFKDMLEELGHVVLTAANGKEGVAMANAEQPDLVLMDIVMPDMNGFQATRQICRGAATSHIPVIIVTRKDQEADKVWGERQGARAYITKPIDRPGLMSVIESVIDK